MSSDTTVASTAPVEGFGSRAYRAYVLVALFIVYMFNFIDRTLVGVLGEPIRETFGLTDAQIGLLAGPAFAVLYTLLGIPVAILAERFSRTTIIAAAMAMWSAMTAFCGMAGNSLMFALGRVGVGIGEAGCSPPSHSLISDYFPPEKRATALAVYSLGIPIGSMTAALAGAYFATRAGLDWRAAFIWLGLPGVALAIIFKLTVKEPPRGYSDPDGGAAAKDRPSPIEVFKVIGSKPAFWHVALGGGLASFVGYGVGQFTTPFFLRAHSLPVIFKDMPPLMEAAIIYGLILGLFAAIGTFTSGWLADKLRDRHPNAVSWLPALGFVIAVPAYIIGFNTLAFSSGSMAVFLSIPPLAVAAVTHYFYLSPMFAVPQNLVAPRMRASAAALLLFIVNIIGYVFGPPVVGWVSDEAAKWNLSRKEGSPTLAACNEIEMARKAMAKEDQSTWTPEQRAEFEDMGATYGDFCAQPRANGIRFAMSVGVLVYLWAALHFLLMGPRLRRDSWSMNVGEKNEAIHPEDTPEPEMR